jgi:hypothetical protein
MSKRLVAKVSKSRGGKSGSSGAAEGKGMELTEEGITLPVTLPPVVFTLFAAAKAADLVDPDLDLDSWLYECVLKRFELDYRLKLMLVPVTGEAEAAEEDAK